jgi:broad specificity phosphatase PhoE
MLTLIRHAQSAANSGLATHDPATIPLTPAGHLHAKHLARCAFPSPMGAVWSSPFLRAVQTATPTAERYGLSVHEVPIHEFTYLCPARCAGTTAVERMQWVDNYWRRGDPHHIDGPGAESFSMFVGRARYALSLFHTAGAGHVAIFSHGQFLQMVYWLAGYRGEPVSEAGMRAYRAMDVQLPIRHCEGLSMGFCSREAVLKVQRWPPA